MKERESKGLIVAKEGGDKQRCTIRLICFPISLDLCIIKLREKKDKVREKSLNKTLFMTLFYEVFFPVMTLCKFINIWEEIKNLVLLF